MGRKKQPKPYDIPDNILGGVTEHTAGGFFLFCFDDQNNFRVYSNFDSELHFKSLKADALKWLQAIDMLENQQMVASLINKK